MPEKKPTSSDSASTLDAKKLNLLPAVKYLLKELDLEHVDLDNLPQMVEAESYSYPDVTETSEKPLDSPAEASGEKNEQSTENVSGGSGRSVPTLKESHSVGASLERYDQIREDKGVKKTDEPEKPLVFRSEVNEEKVVCTLKQPLNVETNIGNLDQNTSPGSRLSGHQVTGTEGASLVDEAWDRLQKSFVYFRGKPVGTLAAIDPSAEPLNYNQVFVRDFVPSGLACLMKNPPEPEIVKNFLLQTLHLQGCQKKIDNYTLGEGVMPASFKVLHDPKTQKETLVADFGGSAIGRVAPVDSVFWWIILLRSYTKCTGDNSFSELPQVQGGIKSILKLCLCDGFNNFPTLLCADGCCMVDRSMGINGYPIEIQSLFYFALRCARQMLKPEHGGKEFFKRIDARITALSFHVQTYYWLDITQLNNIYRYKTEEYSHTAVNKFNIIPDSIPEWLFDFMPLRGGYFMGNVSPGRMDFRWFLAGNCIAILSSLATSEQATAIMDLVEERWEQLIGEVPLKVVYPALEGHYWELVTGCDPKNTPWSYHNGGSWPVLLWLLTAACIKIGRPQIAKRAIDLVEQRLSKDGWPEYYDGKTGRYVGKQARKFQTWSIAGYLVAKMMIENESNLLVISHEEEKKTNKLRHTRSASCFF
ncbi:unnamed protein product, partial [Vitis vinifera]